DMLPGDCSAIISIGADRRMRVAQLIEGVEYSGVADAMSAADAERAARSLAAAVTGMPEAGRLPRTVDMLSLYGAETAADLFGQIAFRWRGIVRNGVLPRPVPIGLESASSPAELALAEG